MLLANRQLDDRSDQNKTPPKTTDDVYENFYHWSDRGHGHACGFVLPSSHEES